MAERTNSSYENNFGELIDLARAAPVMVTKYDRPVVVVMAVEEYERLKALKHPSKSPKARTEKKEREK